MLYPAELYGHMPQTLDFTGLLGISPSAIYKIINSILSCESTDFFALVTIIVSVFQTQLISYHRTYKFSTVFHLFGNEPRWWKYGLGR